MANTTSEIEVSSGDWTLIPMSGAINMVITNESDGDIRYAFGDTAPVVKGHVLDRTFDNIIENITSDIWIKKDSGKNSIISVTRFGV